MLSGTARATFSAVVFDEVANQGVDHLTDGFVDQATPAERWIARLNQSDVAREKADLAQLLQTDEAGAQAIVDIMVVVGNFVGEIAYLRFQDGCPPTRNRSPTSPSRRAFSSEQCFDDALAGFEAQVQTIERRIAILKPIDDAQALQVVFEATVPAHALIQRILPGMAEGVCPRSWASATASARSSFRRSARQTPRDLRHLDAVRQAGTEQVAFVIHETWVLYSRRRNAVEWMMRSRSR